MENDLMEFIEKFFTNLGAEVILQGDFLIVSNIPDSFERFYGKKGPYKFVFDPVKLTPDSEFIEKGSYTMKAISSYLENSGQTTLLKINFDLDPENEIKQHLRFVNCKLERLVRKKKFNFFFRFTFHTTFQYINENEKIINNIYVHNGKIIGGDLSSYILEEGDKNEVKIPEIKESYFIAKEGLKEKIKTKTEELTFELNNRLEKEKQRIERHFSKENEEFADILEKAKGRLSNLEEAQDYEKIDRQRKTIQGIREKINEEELEKDKERAIQIERQKHSLNINNKLFNTTLIYYPLHTFDSTLKSANAKRIIEINFDPLTKITNFLFCEACDKKINEIFLCRTGHISCRDCFIVCESCRKEHCKKCIKIKCEQCNKNICKDCSERCFRCGKLVCNSHTKKDRISQRSFCNNCLRHCERCSNLREPYSFRKSKKTGVEVCEPCFREEMQKTALKGVFD